MKKHDLLKAIGILFLVYVVLSWIIPGGSFSSGVFTKGTTSPLGLGDLFLYPIATSIYQMFILSAVVVLAVGGLYGVLNRSGVLSSMVTSLAKKMKGKETFFLVATTVFYAVISAFLNLTLPLLLVLPLSIAVLISLGFDKIKTFLATFGAIIVGGIATAVGNNMDGYNYIDYFLGVKIGSTILYSIILFVLVLAVLLFFVVKGAKKKPARGRKKKEETTKEEIKAPLYDKSIKAAKRPTAGVVLYILLVLVAFVATFNWSGVGVELFNDLHNSITTFTINDFAIFSKLLGSVTAFGYWGNYELIMLSVLAAMVIAWVYRVSVEDMVDAFVDGAKEMLPVAIVVIFANLLLYTANSSQTPFIMTVFNALFTLSSKFNYFVIASVTALGTVCYSSFPYLLYAVYDPMTSLYAKDTEMIAITMQAIYGIFSLVVPTSVMLVMGLKYLEIPYKEWLKVAWKLLLTLLVIVTIAILIFAAL